ncbi:protein-(glutamine-N5) methyltransferase, release factor-specific [Clostridia bacterium]|nr:protein-(glutamine-N5) methyltransferase, release factor-specific [Clostridia bacterium]
MLIDYRGALADGARRLALTGVPDPDYDAGLLLYYATGVSRLTGMLDNKQLTGGQSDKYDRLLDKRAARIPLQYILGDVQFNGVTIRVDERALIPRCETELICFNCEQYLRGRNDTPRILDLCTGSGAIAIALKHALPNADVFASDISVAALSLARSNAELNGVSIAFELGDLFEPWQGAAPFDMIVSNPPYVKSGEMPELQLEVRREPALALDGGSDGLDFYRRIAAEAPQHLTVGGVLVLEVGMGQSDAVGALLEPRFERLKIDEDFDDIPRMVWGFMDN